MLDTHTAPVGWDDEELLRSANPNNISTDPPDAWGIRTPDYMYAETTVTGEKELYDLAVDPYELENVAGEPQYAAAQAVLATRLDALRP
jgi:hypothetical protein